MEMSIGKNIKTHREERSLTQEQLAEMVGVSFQAVSSWERDEYLPETANVIRLAEVLGVSASAILEDKPGTFKMKDAIYNWEHMKTYIKTSARNLKLPNTLKAVDFATEAHKGVNRKRSSVPYIYHPYNLACHALAMDINDDAVIAACLLHDVVEDCPGIGFDDLPVDDEVKEIVRLVTHEDTTDENRDAVMKAYYKEMLSNPKAVLVKCMDRCHNLSTMAGGLSRDRIFRMIRETEEYYPDLIKVLKDNLEYNDAAWLLKYQIESMLDIYKRLM